MPFKSKTCTATQASSDKSDPPLNLLVEAPTPESRKVMLYLRRSLAGHCPEAPFRFSTLLGDAIPGLEHLAGITEAEFGFMDCQRKKAGKK